MALFDFLKFGQMGQGAAGAPTGGGFGGFDFFKNLQNDPERMQMMQTGLAMMSAKDDEDMMSKLALMNGGMFGPKAAGAANANPAAAAPVTPPATSPMGAMSMMPRSPMPINPNVSQMPPGSNPNLDAIMQAIGRFESGGKYNILGKMLDSGDQAYGKYQIMRSNIGPWSQEALGRRVAPKEFLGSPDIQDQIARHRMNIYYQKYGNPEDVASMWFSGRPYNGNNRRDALGTSVPSYVRNVMQYLNQ